MGHAYVTSDLKVKKPDTNAQTDQDADADGKALGNVVGISNAKRYEDASQCLRSYSDPHDPIVAAEESVLSNVLTVDKDYADEEGGKE
jgi:hypothetical protein